MNVQQLEALISYMETHPKFAAHQYMGCMGSTQRIHQLQRLTDLLNELGPPVKQSQTWERIWNDMRAQAKDQNARYNKFLRMTGNPVEEDFDLDPYLIRVSNVMLGKYSHGLAVIPEAGIRDHRMPMDENNQVRQGEENCLAVQGSNIFSDLLELVTRIKESMQANRETELLQFDEITFNNILN